MTGSESGADVKCRRFFRPIHPSSLTCPPRLVCLVHRGPFFDEELAYVHVVAAGGAVEGAALSGTGLVDGDLTLFEDVFHLGDGR